jgi:SagB-type dehydrogenase family enzyme
MDEAPLFSLFWENSKLNARTMGAFTERLDADARATGAESRLFYPAPDVPLPRPDDPLAHAMEKRLARRAFSDVPLDARQLGSLLYGFAERRTPDAPRGRRHVASAGGKYAVEVFALLFRAEGALGGSIAYYDADTHALTRVGPTPSWADLRETCALEVDGEPAALFVIVAFPERMTTKYGERGGRFVLLECGAYAHALALRAAQEGLAGVEVGALHDDAFAKLLGVDRAGARIALGYACGVAR